MFLTGLIVGAGSAPVHSLIGLLQNTKDAVDKARALWVGNAVRAAAQTDQLLAGAPAGVAPPEVRRAVAVAVEADAAPGEARPRPPGEVETRRRINRLLQ